MSKIIQYLRSSCSTDHVKPDPVKAAAAFVACNSPAFDAEKALPHNASAYVACYSKADCVRMLNNPVPAHESSSGLVIQPPPQPSSYVDMRRPLILAVLALQCCICVLRTAVIRDVVGGFFMAYGCLLGLYAWKEHMNITLIGYWGLMILINGFLDTVKLADSAAHWPSHTAVFSLQLPWAYNFASLVRVMGPISELVGVPLAWFSCKDNEETKLRLELEEKWAGTVSVESVVGLCGAFSGQGQRLGIAWDRT